MKERVLWTLSPRSRQLEREVVFVVPMWVANALLVLVAATVACLKR
jgi:hypothetical protein